MMCFRQFDMGKVFAVHFINFSGPIRSSDNNDFYKSTGEPSCLSENVNQICIISET